MATATAEPFVREILFRLSYALSRSYTTFTATATHELVAVPRLRWERIYTGARLRTIASRCVAAVCGVVILIATTKPRSEWVTRGRPEDRVYLRLLLQLKISLSYKIHNERTLK